jgi:hypothetical protein
MRDRSSPEGWVMVKNGKEGRQESNKGMIRALQPEAQQS